MRFPCAARRHTLRLNQEVYMEAQCTHLDQLRAVSPRTPRGCEECLATGMRWVHLRLCLTCGHVGCCDSSPGKHATKHFRAIGHPIVRSFERDEDWGWCYADQLFFEPAPAPPG
jgi:uncharacterized UBP type Zn finger protein